MRVGCIQSNYIPWRGYFDFIDSVDLFLFHDDIQYTKGDWRNRNTLKFRDPKPKSKWLTVPVHYTEKDQLICDTKIDYSTAWMDAHLNKFVQNYAPAVFFRDALRILENGFSFHDETISQLNTSLIRMICDYYDIETTRRFTSEFKAEGSKTERLVSIMKEVGATTYVSGPAGKNYIDEQLFKYNGIELEWKTYDYVPYPQLWGYFDGMVSVLDVIANCGRDKSLLKSRS